MRRDLSDPRTAENVAALVGDELRLSLLRALTEADSKATGPSAWTSWKVTLLDELTRQVGAILAGRERVTRTFGIDTTTVDERFGNLVEGVRTSGEVRTHHDVAGDFDLWVVAAPDQAGLFAGIVGTLAVHGIDVVGAAAWTSADGIAVDQFRVARPTSGAIDWAKLDHDLRGCLGGTVDVGGKVAHRIRTYSRAHRRAIAAAPPRLEVLVSNDASATTTVIDVRAPDAIAVLYRLVAALAARRLDIRSAKVATLGHEVIDVFYVQRAGMPQGEQQIPDSEHDALREDLKAALTNPV
jgi:[protein-PII] uridylyltransferase